VLDAVLEDRLEQRGGGRREALVAGLRADVHPDPCGALGQLLDRGIGVRHPAQDQGLGQHRPGKLGGIRPLGVMQGRIRRLRRRHAHGLHGRAHLW